MFPCICNIYKFCTAMGVSQDIADCKDTVYIIALNDIWRRLHQYQVHSILLFLMSLCKWQNGLHLLMRSDVCLRRANRFRSPSFRIMLVACLTNIYVCLLLIGKLRISFSKTCITVQQSSYTTINPNMPSNMWIENKKRFTFCNNNECMLGSPIYIVMVDAIHSVITC